MVVRKRQRQRYDLVPRNKLKNKTSKLEVFRQLAARGGVNVMRTLACRKLYTAFWRRFDKEYKRLHKRTSKKGLSARRVWYRQQNSF